jgi:hypothetical protein
MALLIMKVIGLPDSRLVALPFAYSNSVACVMHNVHSGLMHTCRCHVRGICLAATCQVS